MSFLRATEQQAELTPKSVWQKGKRLFLNWFLKGHPDKARCRQQISPSKHNLDAGNTAYLSDVLRNQTANYLLLAGHKQVGFDLGRAAQHNLFKPQFVIHEFSYLFCLIGVKRRHRLEPSTGQRSNRFQTQERSSADHPQRRSLSSC